MKTLQNMAFMEKRTVPTLTTNINKKEVMKIPRTGHYLFRGHSEKSYNRIITDVGDSLMLTSGVRSIPKQMNLYFNKIKKHWWQYHQSCSLSCATSVFVSLYW